MTLSPSVLQSRAAWGAHTYSAAFNADPRPHRDFAHAVLHITKALGKLATEAYRRDAPAPERCRRALADVLICLCRAANTAPGGTVDLGREFDRGCRRNPRGIVLNPISMGVIELTQSVGLLASIVDAMDHDEPWTSEDVGVELASTWRDTLSLASHFSLVIGPFDLAAAVDARLAEKGIGPKVAP